MFPKILADRHTLFVALSCILSVTPHHTHIQTLSSLSVHLRTMVSCGIQSLTVLLCVVLILSTGAIIGGFTLSTWDDLLEKARDTGDEGFGMCLDSGTADIETVSARYLRSVLGNVDAAVKEYLKMPEQLMMSVVNLAQAHHPDVSTSPAFIKNIVRRALISSFKAGADAGLAFLEYEAYPWSPAHPVPWKMSDGYAGWGARSRISPLTTLGGILPTNGTKVITLMELLDPVTLQPGQSDMMAYSEVNDVGDWKYPSEPCNFPDYSKGEVKGMCFYPAATLEPPGSETYLAHQRGLHNLGADDPPLNPVHTFAYAPAVARWSSMYWDISYTFTHPDMYTMYPKQGKRVGTVTSSATTQGISDVVRAQLLPAGTSLYLVEDSSGSVGTVVAYNRGRELRMVREMSAIGIVLNLAYSINITNHSMEDATSHIPSVIAEHGQFAFRLPRNYRDLVEMTKASFLKWSDSNGTEFWTITSTIERGTIFWYSTLLVPRTSVMDTIDASTNAIRAKVASDLSSADAQKEDAVTVMAIVTAVAVIGLLAIAVVFTRYITSPLLKLGREMANVAVMDLEAVDTGRAVSQLSEVGMMQRSFVTMVANLQKYKKFLPGALFEEKEQDIVRNSRPPPGITSGTATLVFTDIRSSTSIWEAVPQGMCEALKIHNRIIREAMDEFEGYEVKTIGDAFMVAFATVLDGVNFGLRVHEALRNATWPAELLHFKLCADTGPLWGGLTVRIGVNAGPVTVEKNTLTGRTDYFGHTVNVASRLESTCQPGAVGLRHEVWQEECSGVCSAAVGEVNRIELKGVSGKTPVCCVWPPSLAGRVTNPLTERRLSAGSSSVHTTASSVVSHTSIKTMSSTSTMSLPGSVSTSGRLATVGIVQVAVGDEAHVSAMRTMSTHLITLKSCLDRSGGRMVSVIGSFVCIAWNLSHAAPAHVENSLRFVQYLHGTSSVRVGGLVTGTVHHGDVSAKTLRFVTVLGDAVQKCWCLCIEAKKEEVFFLYEPPVDTVLPQNLERALSPHRTGVYVVKQKRDTSQLDPVVDNYML